MSILQGVSAANVISKSDLLVSPSRAYNDATFTSVAIKFTAPKIVTSTRRALKNNTNLSASNSHFFNKFCENVSKSSVSYGKSPRDLSIRCGMKAAQELVIEGKVKALPAHLVKKFLAENPKFQILDVRPIWEREKAYLVDSLHVPLFVEDESKSFTTAIKKQIQFGFGGWWLGQKLTRKNEEFASQVKALVEDENSPLLVACGEGLRSLLAIEVLDEAGFRNLAWIAGGFNNAREGDFENVAGSTKLWFSTAGGVQGMLLNAGQFASSFIKDLGADAPKP